MVQDKTLPHNIEAEESVLGSVLIDSERYWEVCTLNAEDFYRDKNVWVWEAIQSVDMRNQVTVAHALANKGRLEAIGGASYLSHLVGNCGSSVHARYYADIVKLCSDSRKLIRASGNIESIGYEQKPNMIDLSLSEILSLRADTGGVFTPRQLAEHTIDHYSRLASGELHMTYFGIRSLDLLGGMQPGEYVVVGGETEMGKSTLLKQIANAQKGEVLYATTEMTKDQWAQRVLASAMHIPMSRLGSEAFVKNNIDNIILASGKMDTENITIITGSITPNRIRAEASKIANLKLIIVDYLQRMRGVTANYESVSIASRDLADMAKDTNIPLIVASQLSRENPQAKEKKQLIDRLKDSGNIANDADWIIFISRNKNAKPHTEEYLDAKLNVEKHKQGGEHPEIPMKFDLESQWYHEKAEKQATPDQPYND
jgi:replicative DNA helicase